eukprot:scaffold51643_cov63-Phaeocystis_antarctica.AAC.3
MRRARAGASVRTWVHAAEGAGVGAELRQVSLEHAAGVEHAVTESQVVRRASGVGEELQHLLQKQVRYAVLEVGGVNRPRITAGTMGGGSQVEHAGRGAAGIEEWRGRVSGCVRRRCGGGKGRGACAPAPAPTEARLLALIGPLDVDLRESAQSRPPPRAGREPRLVPAQCRRRRVAGRRGWAERASRGGAGEGEGG